MKLHSVLKIVWLLLLVSCSKPVNQEVNPRNKPTVYTVNYPLKYFAERIGGDAVEVVFPDMGGDPAFWNPGPEEVVAYQGADLVLLNGASYAKWVNKVSLPQSKLVDTSSAFKDQYIELEHSETHTHGPGGEHAHGDMAFTTWLDPQLALQQALAIKEAFVTEWPEHKERFQSGFASLEVDLRELDGVFTRLTAGSDSVPLVMSHPVYQYLERRYALNAISVHWEPDTVPGDNMVRELRELLVGHVARWMVWEAKPLDENVQRLRNLGLDSVVFDPCASEPEQGDYLSVMQRNHAALQKVFGQQ